MKPWKSKELGAPTPPEASFNGATAMKPWKSLWPWARRGRTDRFNGATAMKPWKRQVQCPALPVITVLQWGHGDEAVEEIQGKTRGSMMSALQWGHGDEAVEESTPHAPRPTLLNASMGPRR